MNKRKIYIITPSFNTFNDLNNLYHHLNCFDKSKFIWIIMDGGSVDDTKDFFLNNASNWFIFNSENDYGIYDALNRGILKYVPLNQYYLVSGSDDLPDVNSIFDVINYDDISNSHIILGNVEYPMDRVKKPKLIPGDFKQSKISFHSVGMIINRNVHDLIGLYSTKFVTVSDELFFHTAISDERIDFRVVDKIFGFYSNSGISASEYLLVTTEMFYLKSKLYSLSFKDIFMLFIRLCKFKLTK